MSSARENPSLPAVVDHHIRQTYCQNRPLYRRSRQLTAVRVYSVANESRHLLVFGVPQIDLLRELRQEFARIGKLETVENITAIWQQHRDNGESDTLTLEPFTDVFHVCFVKLEKARQAKRSLDARNFYGGVLHISYAPERETVAEVRAKLSQRRSEVRYRTKGGRLKTKPKQAPSLDPVGGVGDRRPGIRSGNAIPHHRQAGRRP
ncbi:RNA-binding protein 48 [Anopheles bellator]|uniref:RNA-binding protein 48 n=1 Tax=Anopheles bellator TaxID=139047 RepID=UPI0026481919|nr:RNA-binding protein 48 [Anopheles bellator]